VTGRARTAVVTGAGGHVGRALLRHLGRAGDRTVGVDRPGTSPPADGGPAVDRWIGTDLADPISEAELRTALAEVPRIDLLVLAAGVTALGGIETTDDAAFRRVMDVNYHGALRATRACLPALRAARGHVVAVSSVAGLVPVAGRPAYVGAKHALTGVFLALATELGPDGVAVTVVHPTFLTTPVTEVGAPTARTMTGAALTADDVARAIVRLAARRRAGRRVPTRVLLGRTAYVADTVGRLAPDLARRLAGRRLRQQG
jgi:NAD(P)-dependent dehydrogenase (short-subunit alcohol dehydrogenase family)